MPWLRARTLAVAVFAQAGAALVVMLPYALPAASSGGVSRALVQGAAAALLGGVLGLPRWWLAINSALPPLAIALLALAIEPAWYLAAFAAAYLIYGSGPLRSGVPLHASPPQAARVLSGLLSRERRLRVLDAGSGSGSLLLAVARRHPQAEFCGIESGLVPWALARLRAALRASPTHFHRGDFWAVDFGRHDLVYAFLSSTAMPRLWEKARREMRPGALLVSLDFEVPGQAPAQVLALEGGTRRLLVWVM